MAIDLEAKLKQLNEWLEESIKDTRRHFSDAVKQARTEGSVAAAEAVLRVDKATLFAAKDFDIRSGVPHLKEIGLLVEVHPKGNDVWFYDPDDLNRGAGSFHVQAGHLPLPGKYRAVILIYRREP